MSRSEQNHAALWWQFTRRELESRHRGSHLGVLWMLLTPLLEFAIYATVFGVIFGGRYGVVEGETQATYALGVFLSLTLYRVAAETLATSSTIIVNQPNLVKKVVFPLHILPLAALGGIVFRVAISLTLLACALLAAGPSLTAYALWFPLVLLPLLIGSVGVAWLFSSLGVFFRDLSQMCSPVSMIVLYTSAVFYSAEKISKQSEVAWDILKWNPLLHLIEDSRRVLLWGMPPTPDSLSYAWVFATAVLFTGWWVFRRLRPAFADVL